MGVLPPVSYHSSNTNWFLEHGRDARWAPAGNKMFEYALAVHDEDTSDLGQKVAAKIPGKTMEDVMLHYRDLELDVGKIEARLIPTPGYTGPPHFTLKWVAAYMMSSNILMVSESKEGKDPHRLGLQKLIEERFPLDRGGAQGLNKYGKRDWRNISRNFVVTRTPTQVASHAQKYYIRQLSGGKDKRRVSIHDITTVNLSETRFPCPYDKRHPSPDCSTSVTLVQQPIPALATSVIWNQPGNARDLGLHCDPQKYVLDPSAHWCRLHWP